ncbi:hypothetical protein BSK53_19420 [Paenibacillus odorifer]|nr:hypothetical protein BSK50_21370 [Paenibacillus odorifer]OMD81189.1 hypothetical protein BSK53_19420 [Paenibacillus odorifer]
MRILQMDDELFMAALAQVHVTVREKEDVRIKEHSGPIQKYTPVSVKNSGAYYMRINYNFPVTKEGER